MKLAGVILAGGRSQRMGVDDKFMLDLGGQPILSHVIDRLKPQVGEIVISANGDPSRFAEYSLPVMADTIEGSAGPLAGVLAGMDWAAGQGFDYIVTAAADTPFFPADLVLALKLARYSEHLQLAMAMTADPKRGLGLHPTFALWDVDLREDLRAALNNGLRKVIEWTEPMGCAHVVFEFEGSDPFFNVNRPEDLEKANAMLKEFTE